LRVDAGDFPAEATADADPDIDPAQFPAGYRETGTA
jgi:hypothetical protein